MDGFKTFNLLHTVPKALSPPANPPEAQERERERERERPSRQNTMRKRQWNWLAMSCSRSNKRAVHVLFASVVAVRHYPTFLQSTTTPENRASVMTKTPRDDYGTLHQSQALLSGVEDSESTSLTPDTGLPTDLATWEADSASVLDSVLEALVVPECEWPTTPINRTCKYRNGRCSQPRTRKKSGDLHSFCDHHRQKSIQNQRRFDQKRRLARLARLGKGLDFASPRVHLVRANGNDDYVTLLSSPNDLTRRESPASECKRVMSTVDEVCDGECRCGKKCKDIRYDINFITNTSVVI
jgi:hypothetical protein